MAGLKLSAKAMEEYEFLESLLHKCDHLATLTEQYVGAKGATQEQTFQAITRTLGHIRQNAMMKNLGPIADAAGMLGVAAARGSIVQRARTLRDGIASYKVNVERTMKALVAADAREKKEQEKVMEARTRAKEQMEREAARQAQAKGGGAGAPEGGS
jgi:hypothetical protein